MSGESDLSLLLANKEAENVRLHAEIKRLRAALTEAESKPKSEVEDDYQNSLIQRQSVLSSARAASESVEGLCYQLQTSLAFKTAEIERLEDQLESQASSHALRLSEIQDSYLAKISTLRNQHQEQLAASMEASESYKLEAKNLRTTLDQCREKHERVAKEMETHRNHAQELLSRYQEDIKALKADLQLANDNNRGLQGRCRELQDKLDSHLVTHPASTRDGGEEAVVPQETAPVTDSTSPMLVIMEGQLARLSGIIRSREEELQRLKVLVQTGAEERQRLLEQIQRVKLEEKPSTKVQSPVVKPRRGKLTG